MRRRGTLDIRLSWGVPSIKAKSEGTHPVRPLQTGSKKRRKRGGNGIRR